MTARQIDGNGWIEIKGNPISKCGVFQYLGKSIPIAGLMPDKMYNVYRSAEELSNPDTIESFKLVPLIEDHAMLGPRKGIPAEEKGIEGTTGEDVYFEDPYLKANIKIFSESLSHEIDENEKKELSLGYTCLWLLENGVYNGEEYQIVQRKPRGNHVAVVKDGRSGSDVAVLDQKESLNEVITMDPKEKEASEKKEVKDEGEEQGLTLAGLHEAIKALSAKLDKLTAAAPENKAQDEDPVEKKKEEGKAQDADPDKKDDSKPAMDASELRKSIYVELNQKNQLAEQLSEHIGVFDSAEMDLDEVASYGVQKLKLGCKKGQETAVLTGFLAGKKVDKKTAVGGVVMDAKPKVDVIENWGQIGA